jgi:hypothetical protein
LGSTAETLNGGSAQGGGISNNNGRSHTLSLAIAPDGIPHVGWQDDSDGDYEIYLRRWNADENEWEEVGAGSASGGGISNTTGYSWQASLTTDQHGAITNGPTWDFTTSPLPTP